MVAGGGGCYVSDRPQRQRYRRVCAETPPLVSFCTNLLMTAANEKLAERKEGGVVVVVVVGGVRCLFLSLEGRG